MKGRVHIWCEPSASGARVDTVMHLRYYNGSPPMEFTAVYQAGGYEQTKRLLIDKFVELPEPEDIEINPITMLEPDPLQQIKNYLRGIGPTARTEIVHWLSKEYGFILKE